MSRDLIASKTLPILIDRAAHSLTSARSAAEVLEARDMASVAYDAAKKVARFLAAKGAHDSVIATVHQAQADALEIEARAKHRLADEYDDAQERGDAALQGRPKKRLEKKTFFQKGNGRDMVADALLAAQINDQLDQIGNEPAHLVDLRLTKAQIHEARIVRDAEEADPGIVRRTLDEKLKTGAGPTKAVLRKALKAANPTAPQPPKRKAKKSRAVYVVETDSQHDRDLQMLLSTWEMACPSARDEFLRTVNMEAAA